jgi:hypothetical protein
MKRPEHVQLQNGERTAAPPPDKTEQQWNDEMMGDDDVSGLLESFCY